MAALNPFPCLRNTENHWQDGLKQPTWHPLHDPPSIDQRWTACPILPHRTSEVQRKLCKLKKYTEMDTAERESHWTVEERLTSLLSITVQLTFKYSPPPPAQSELSPPTSVTIDHSFLIDKATGQSQLANPSGDINSDDSKLCQVDNES